MLYHDNIKTTLGEDSPYRDNVMNTLGEDWVIS